MIDKLSNKNYKVSLLLDFEVSCDWSMEPEQLVDFFKKQIIIKKTHDKFVITDVNMEYEVFTSKLKFDDEELLDV